MGFKVIVRKNGVQHGESHYSSEAVAAGMAKKMRNAGADVTLARCNGACCATANPRRPKQPPVWEREGHSQRNPRRNGKKAKMPPANAEAVAAARAIGKTAYARGVKSAPWGDMMLRPLIAAHPNDHSTMVGIMDAWQKEWNKAHQIASNAEVAALGIFPKANPRRNGTTAGVMAASRSMSHRFGLSRNPSMDADTASTLIKQLGGMGKLIAMVGAKDFMRTERNGHPALSFKFKGSTKANYVNIALDPSDTYTLQFGKIVKYDLKPTGEFHGIYADQLKRTFEKFTGLYLSL